MEAGFFLVFRDCSADIRNLLTNSSALSFTRIYLLWLLGSNWRTGWEVYFDKWGRDGNAIFYVVNNLEPETTYSFRVIAVNKMGASLASDATVALKTGKVFYLHMLYL